jgi:hypothetical protein
MRWEGRDWMIEQKKRRRERRMRDGKRREEYSI